MTEQENDRLREERNELKAYKISALKVLHDYRQALEFYADYNNYWTDDKEGPTAIGHDNGSLARKALEGR